MSANLYNVNDLLIGKPYRSTSIEGVIVGAEPWHTYYQDADAYRVRIRTERSWREDTYRIIAVSRVA